MSSKTSCLSPHGEEALLSAVSNHEVLRCSILRDARWRVLLKMRAGELMKSLDRHGDALADTDAHGGERALATALLHAVHRRQRQPRAAHAQRMAERNRAAMRIDEIGILLDAQLAQASDTLRSEGLIELDQIEIADLE